MAVQIEWQDETGNVLASYSGPPLTWKVLGRAPGGSICARFIDPIGDTTFNQKQIDVLAEELTDWASRDDDPVIRHVLNFVRERQGEIHTYLKLVGD